MTLPPMARRESKPEQSTELWAMWATLRARLTHCFRGDDRSVSPGPEVALLVDDISAAHLTLSGGPGSRAPDGQVMTKLAQKLGQLQPFIAAFSQECMGQLASSEPT